MIQIMQCYIISNWLMLRLNFWFVGNNEWKLWTCHKVMYNLYHIMLYRVHFAEGGKLTGNFKSIVSIHKCKSDYYNILLAMIPQISDKEYGGNRNTQRNPLTIYHMICIKYTSPWAGFELTTLVVRGTGYTSSSKFNYNTATTTTTTF
jgi:hypothetical protein